MSENTFKKALDISTKIDGWLTDKEASVLYSLANKCKKGTVIIEIGSWKGKSTIILGLGSMAGNKNPIIAIDPHTGSPEHHKRYGKVWTFEEFKSNVKRANLDSIVNPLVMTSEEAVSKIKERIGLIFIDGDHCYEMVEKDYKLWFPKLEVGGIIAFHDTMGKPGPKKVVSEFIFKSKVMRNIRYVDTLTFGEKVHCNTLVIRLKNRIIQINKDISETLYNLLKEKKECKSM